MLHREIAMAAIANGKVVYCEKPVGLSGSDARAVAAAARQAGIHSLTGYTYLRNPMVGLARELIAEGALGDIVLFRGTHNEDYLADPAHPFTWRCDQALAGKAGALGDLGSHIISIALHLVGDIAAVTGETKIVTGERMVGATRGSDERSATTTRRWRLLRFANGVQGYVEASRIAT